MSDASAVPHPSANKAGSSTSPRRRSTLFLLVIGFVAVLAFLGTLVWNEKTLPTIPYTIPERDVATILSSGLHHLDFDTSDDDWHFNDVEHTTRRLNSTNIRFELDRIYIGTGETGLRNLDLIVSRLPPGTYVSMVHELACEENRWSNDLRMLGARWKTSRNIVMHCDGGF